MICHFLNAPLQAQQTRLITAIFSTLRAIRPSHREKNKLRGGRPAA
jgi:hypothetical protein